MWSFQVAIRGKFWLLSRVLKSSDFPSCRFERNNYSIKWDTFKTRGEQSTKPYFKMSEINSSYLRTRYRGQNVLFDAGEEKEVLSQDLTGILKCRVFCVCFFAGYTY